MKHSDHHNEHERKKALRSSQWQEPVHDEKHPSQERLSQELTTQEQLKRKEGRLTGNKRSKRTNPSEVFEKTSPQHSRTENEHWLHSQESRSQHDNQKLSRKILHANQQKKGSWSK